jgi:hypothetical protein
VKKDLLIPVTVEEAGELEGRRRGIGNRLKMEALGFLVWALTIKAGAR